MAISKKIDSEKVPQAIMSDVAMKVPTYLFLFDLDETLYDHRDPGHYWLHELDAYLANLRHRIYFNYGIISGCNVIEGLRKIECMALQSSPDYLVFGYGTHLYRKSDHPINSHQMMPDSCWMKREHLHMPQQVITQLLKCLVEQNIILISEKRSFNPSKESFYYYPRQSVKEDLRLIRKIAAHYSVNAIISHCNDNIGDPCDAYDIDFVPIHLGKEKVSKYLISTTGVSNDRVYAFGDSQNDLHMLKTVAHGFAVANATPNLKSYITQVTPYQRAQGILHTLIHLVRDGSDGTDKK